MVHSDDAPVSSLLLLRVSERQDGDLSYDAIDRSAGVTSQSLTINAPRGDWRRRTVYYQPKSDGKVYLHVVLYGNPATVWIDDLVFTDTPYQQQARTGAILPAYSKDEALAILAKRSPAAGWVTNADGHCSIIIDGRPTPGAFQG